MSKVCYLLGAGASYGKRHISSQRIVGSGKYADISIIDEGLPIVNEINSELEKIIEDLKNFFPNYQIINDKINRLLNDLEWLNSESKRHMTVDTFAKKVFLQNDNVTFDRLKKTLSSFFLIEQIKYPLDKRYDAFLANILTLPKKQIPDDIIILTWNYDSQIELAYREFNMTNQPTVAYWESIRNQLNIKDSHDNETRDGKIYKLNGTAIFDSLHSLTVFAESAGNNKKEYYNAIAESHKNFKDKNHLHFAWESKKDSKYFKDINNQISNVETLVVIGYTFPYFNRQIDRMIFENMLLLNTIYIQDPYAERIAQNIQPVLSDRNINSNVKIIPLTDVDQFYLPREL